MKNLKMKHKLLIAFLVLSLVPILAGGGIIYYRMHGDVEQQAFEGLKVAAERKHDKIVAYFDTAAKEMQLIASGQTVKDAVSEMKAHHARIGASETGAYDISSPEYKRMSKSIDPFFESFVKISGFDDIIIICAAHGHVMYSTSKESDIGTNLGNGQYKDSVLAGLWRKIVETGQPAKTDFEFYLPSKGIAAFVGMPMIDAGGKVGAVIVFQFDEKEIDAIMQKAVGMGNTGEAYLVGRDFVMRTQSRLTAENTILKREVRTEGAKAALAGKTGQAVYKDYRGTRVLGYFAPIEGTEWAMVAEIDMSEVDAPVVKLRNTILIVCLLSALAVVIVSLIISRQIELPLIRLMAAAKVISGGNLRETVKVETDDEVGQVAASFNTMVGGLLRMTREVRNVSEGVSSASEELSSSAEELNATSEEMSQAIQQIAKGAESTSQQLTDSTKAVSEMTQLAGEVLTTTRSAAQSAMLAIGTAREGAQAAKEAKERINRVFDVVRESSDSAKSFEKRSGQITEIVETITGFADQTNLLALNAAIEAARAGEAGRGFAVVAEEVRKLAENSGRAAKEIGDLIRSIQEEVGTAVASMERGFEEVHASRDVIVKAGTALEGLAGTVEQNAAMFTQIQSANERMGDAARDVMRAFESIAAMAEESSSATEETSASTEEMTASMQELASSAQELADMAARLQKEIAQFKVE